MKILITGGCGFIGSNLAIFLKKKKFNVFSLDNLYRIGSLANLNRLKKNKIKNFKINIENHSKVLKLPTYDMVIDCCAEPSVEASKNSVKDAKRVFDTNLNGTFNILQKTILEKAGIIFLSTSRVYSILALKKIIKNKNVKKKIKKKIIINEAFDTSHAKSLYGFTKLSSEMLIKELNYSNQLNYIINRFGVVAGPWQFGKTDQGFVSLWCWNYLNKRNMQYIGFGGYGNQVRDIIHIDDVCEIILKQINNFKKIKNKTFNISGGKKNAISLKDLSLKLKNKFSYDIKFSHIKKTSIFDIPYFIGSNTKVKKFYNWSVKKNINNILSDIIIWQRQNRYKLRKYFT